MNWDAIGAIAELLGAIGVIASLVYLATQIRQSREQMERNTRALRAGSYQQFFQNLDGIVNRALDSPDRERAVRLGTQNFDQLDAEDAFRFDFWARGMLYASENAYYQFRSGMLDDDRWHLHRGQLTDLLSLPGVVRWWSQYRHIRSRFPPEFVALVEEILGEGADRAQ